MSDASIVHLPGNQPVTLEPSTLTEAMHLASVLAKSTLLPRHLQGNPANVLLVMMRARQLGISMFEGMQHIHVVDGKTGMDAELMASLVQRASVTAYVRLIESSDKVAIYEAKRRDHPEPIRMSYRIEQAQRAGLTGKDNWRRHPEAMLRARCLSALIRANFQDCLSGVYSRDEAEEIAERGGSQTDLALPPVPASEAAASVVAEQPPVPGPGLAALLPEDTTPPPATRERPRPTGKRTADLNRRLAAKLAHFAPPREEAPTPSEPTAPAAPAEPRRTAETPWVRILALGRQYGRDTRSMGGLVKGATGKSKIAELDDDDVARVHDSLVALAQPGNQGSGSPPPDGSDPG